MKIISENRKAYHDYEIVEKLEVGIVLVGSEIKSIRNGKTNLKDAYVILKNDELFVVGMHISTYEKTSAFAPDPVRTRKLLAHREEIEKLDRKVKVKGFSLVPLKLYLENNQAKLEIGLGKGKHDYEKREALREKQTAREIMRELKNN